MRTALALTCILAVLAVGQAGPAAALSGKVVDAVTKAAIPDAVVTAGGTVVNTGPDGSFTFDADPPTVRFRAPGFERRDVPVQDLSSGEGLVSLERFRPKALYLTVHGIGSSKLREAALDLVDGKALNALVIDIKGDRGEIPFRMPVPLAEEVGAQKLITIKDVKALMARLKERHVYTIARIVVFKDDPLAAAHPEWAVRLKGGGIFRDRENLRWVDPFRREVWDYNIAVAKQAAEAGFDEIQFDYVRFPDRRGVVFSKPADEDTRTEAITGFLRAAHTALAPWNVFVGADIFGYVCWNQNDTDIGQKIEPISKAVDIVSPMLYPSGFQFGIPGYRNPVQHPYEIVFQTLDRCRERAGISPLRFRPWLQAFRDYAFRGGNFGEKEVAAQVRASNAFGSNGFHVWNPHNVYPSGGYAP